MFKSSMFKGSNVQGSMFKGSNVQGSVLDFRCSIFNIEATPRSLFSTKRHNTLIVMKSIVLINNALCISVLSVPPWFSFL